jgi:general secretion pathway protein H
MRRALCGFTLFELLLVLAILATTAVVVVPRLAPSPGADVDAASRIVVAGLRQARSRAVTRGEEVVVMVDLERKRFTMQSGPIGSETESSSRRERALPGGVDYRLFTAQQEQVSEHLAGVRFYPDGSSTGGRVTAVAGKHERLIDIDWLTGQIRVTRPEAG